MFKYLWNGRESSKKAKNKNSSSNWIFQFLRDLKVLKAVTGFPVVYKCSGEPKKDLKGLGVKRDGNQKEEGKRVLKKAHISLRGVAGTST